MISLRTYRSLIAFPAISRFRLPSSISARCCASCRLFSTTGACRPQSAFTPNTPHAPPLPLASAHNLSRHAVIRSARANRLVRRAALLDARAAALCVRAVLHRACVVTIPTRALTSPAHAEVLNNSLWENVIVRSDHPSVRRETAFARCPRINARSRTSSARVLWLSAVADRPSASAFHSVTPKTPTNQHETSCLNPVTSHSTTTPLRRSFRTSKRRFPPTLPHWASPPAQIAAQAADSDYYSFVLACQQIIRAAGFQWTSWKDLTRGAATPTQRCARRARFAGRGRASRPRRRSAIPRARSTNQSPPRL